MVFVLTMPPSRLAQLRELDRKGQLYEAVKITDGPGAATREVKPAKGFEEPQPYISTRTRHNYGYDVLDRGQPPVAAAPTQQRSSRSAQMAFRNYLDSAASLNVPPT